jgi:hypothetical protein
LIVTLTPEEVRVCTILGTERWLTKFGSIDKPNYAQGKADGKLEHELLANVRANVCEWAVAKHYNLSWNTPWYPNNFHPYRKRISDVSHNGEVRSVRTQTSIPLWEKDKDTIIFGTKCLDTEFFSQVQVYGYCSANDYMKPEYWDNYINGWRIPVELFML